MYYSVIIKTDLKLHEVLRLLVPVAEYDLATDEKLLHVTQLVKKPRPPTGRLRGRPPKSVQPIALIESAA